tara:strand:- start:2639 stop:2863 length:225 start_codon:yes stop_codon:yes gene_type:complete
MLDKESIEERKQSLLDDMQKNNEQQSQLQKALEDARALGHALNGAVQQCDDFLQKLDGGDDTVSSIPDKKGSDK